MHQGRNGNRKGGAWLFLKPPFHLPAQKGTYCLVFSLSGSKELKVKVKSGKTFLLSSGTYIYVGSAFGGGGLGKRVARHLSGCKNKHWHIDFLTVLPAFKALQVWLALGVKIECETAKVLHRTCVPVPGFGSTDCSCPSHLFIA